MSLAVHLVADADDALTACGVATDAPGALFTLDLFGSNCERCLHAVFWPSRVRGAAPATDAEWSAEQKALYAGISVHELRGPHDARGGDK